MAEGALGVLLEQERPGKFEVVSSGTSAATGFPATMYAIEAAKVWDIDLSEHFSQPLVKVLIDQSDLIFAMTPSHLREVLRLAPEAAGKAYLFKTFLDHDPDGASVADPIGEDLQQYNETFLEIGEYLGQYLPEIVERIDAKQDVS